MAQEIKERNADAIPCAAVNCPGTMRPKTPMDTALAREFTDENDPERIHHHNPKASVVKYECEDGHWQQIVVIPECFCGWLPKTEPNPWW